MATDLNEAQVSLPSDREVLVTRRFSAPRALVYEAYTRPELVQRWLGGPGWSMPVCEMDVRAGGAFRWRWRSDEDGSEFGFHGEFLEVVAPAKIRNTEIFDPARQQSADLPDDMAEALVTVEFTEDGVGTVLTTRVEYESKEARDAAVATGMTDGMEVSYKRLDELLAERAGG